MKKHLLLLALILSLALSKNVAAQFTRQQAINLVMNQILISDIGFITVYCTYAQESQPNGIEVYRRPEIPLPYSSAWVFFSDDLPFANWYHSCRYIFVNSVNGEYSIVSSDSYPVTLNGDYEIISQAPVPGPFEFPQGPFPTISRFQPNQHLHAVLICGPDGARHWWDIAYIYNALLQFGYTEENIIVLFSIGSTTCTQFGNDLDHDLIDDIDDDANKATIDATFATLRNELGQDDQLFIYINGDGAYDLTAQDYYFDCSDVVYFTSDLSAALENINCAQMIIIMQTCQSGGFIGPLLETSNTACKNRIVQTAANSLGVSNAELWITNGVVDEFTYYWTAAVRGAYFGFPWDENGFPVGERDELGHYFFYYTPIPNHPDDYNPDVPTLPPGYGFAQGGNGDGCTQLWEVFNYTNNMDTWSHYGFFNNNPPGGSPEIETPLMDKHIGFETDLHCIYGIAGTSSWNESVAGDRNYMLGGEISVANNSILTLSASTTNGGFYFGNDSARIVVNEGCGLHIGNNYSFHGGQHNNIQVNGSDFSIGQNVSFSHSGTGNYFAGLMLNNEDIESTLDHVTFDHTYLWNFGNQLNVTNGTTFNNSYLLRSYSGNVTINNSVFNNTALLLNNFFADENFEIHVEYNSFSSNSPSLTGISAWNYKKFSIKNNEISGFRNGLEMNQCGLGTTINQVISDNTIHDNLISGIVIYTSNAYVSKNHLYQNDFGVRLLNNSNIALAGNPSANMLIGTQTIMDNDGIEVYTNTNSFPSYFRYNAVIDEDNLGNPDDPLLFFDRPCGTHISKNIQYNCWGNNFNPDEDLKSCNVDFYPYPTWCPTGGELAIPGPDEVLYNTGVSQFDSGYYTGAQSSFQSLVQQYPESKYAEASLKELYQLEEYAANDYPGLREYYLTNDSIMADTALSDVGDFLANKCNVKIQNWPDAILWYENKIENPEVPEDTIFSIIDLGYIYILMENEGTKNSYIGSLPQYKPKSFEDFNRRKNELLELLPLKHNFNPFEESLRTLQSESLMQNIPNPFSTSTDIWYKLSDPAGVQIKFYDNFGRIVRIITKGEVSEGTHKITFDAAGLSAGIYHCTLEVNGTLAGTKNMVVVK